MKKKSIPPFMLTEGQRGRILFEFTLGDGAEVPELCGALMVHGQRVDMEAEDEGTLVIPVLPAGVYLAEVRASGVCVLYGHVEVLPSPLRQTDGDAVFRMAVDCTQDVLQVRLALAEGIPGRRGETGPQGEKGAQGEPGLSAYELACLHGYAGSEAEWVAAFEGAQAAVREAKARAEDAEEAARAADDAREAAAADKAVAETARTQAQAAQTKAEQEAERAEGYAGQLGYAALKGADNTFSGANTFSGEVKFNAPISGTELVRWQVLQHKYDSCTSVDDMAAIDPNYMADLNTGYISVLPNLTSGTFDGLKTNPPAMPQRNHFLDAFVNYQGEEFHFYTSTLLNQGAPVGFFRSGSNLKNLKRFFGWFPNCVNIESLFSKCQSLEEFNVPSLPNCTIATLNWQSSFAGTQLREFHTEMNALVHGGASYGKGMLEDCKNLRVCSVGFPSLKTGNRMLYGCMLNKASAIIVLNSLQPSDGIAGTTANRIHWDLGIGIHVDHQADEAVLAAIDAATARGWTVSVQWNGTATAATFALRPAPPLPVYAQLTMFTDEEGTEHSRLSWCHQITSPDGREPEELGYTLFESVDAAREYFGLPEDD